ncbi:MAG: hypothetical protein J6A59_05305 [Lachnospiraceae bacterium]|nr:hypothetical protein [Lachnospiraceae bacterium]
MTIIVMTSQLMGCASVSSNEMLELLQAGESIEIEVAMPSYYEEEQGEEILASWTELGLLETNKDFRLAFDDATYTHSAGEVGKNGPMYIDLDGNWTNNSTLHYAMMNKTFVEKYWNDNTTKDSLREAILEAYVDIDENDSEKVRDAVIINAYFNLFNDHEEAYANPNSTLTRGEFLAGLVKADTPVDKELANSPEFLSCIGEQTDLTLIAELADAHSYLNSKDKSLDTVTFNGTISKAEAVYAVVQRYFGEEFSKVTGKEEAYADTKNAGNIALRAKFINEKENSYPDKWKAYTLSSMLQNPEKGLDEEFYKAYVVVKQHNLLPSGVTDSNWDEAITKAEAIDLIIKAYEAIAKRDGYATNQQDGLNEGSVVGRGDSETVENGEAEGNVGADVEVDGEVVEGSTLTQEEIDELKASGDSSFQMALDAYEAITSGGTYTASSTGNTFDKVVGIPNEDGWVRVDASKGTIYFDEEAWLEAASASVPPKNDVKVEGLDESEWDYWM